MQGHKNHNIIGLSVIYTVVIVAAISGVVAYNAQGKMGGNGRTSENTMDGPATNDQVIQGVEQTSAKFYSAPRDNTALDLPINVILGSDVQNDNSLSDTDINTPASNNTPAGSTSTQAIRKTNTPEIITCATINMCNKIRFSDDISTARKTRYTKSILDIIGGINKNMNVGSGVSASLFSILITNQKGDRRGRGGTQTIQLNTKDIETLQEFKEILTHEIGHIVDLGVLVGSGETLDTKFTLGGKAQFNTNDISLSFYSISRLNSDTRRASASYTDFVGGYAMTSPYEDFSESRNMFLWHNTAFRVMAKNSPQLTKKYKFFEKLLGGFSFAKDLENAKRVIAQPTRRPRDTSTIAPQ